MQLDDDDDDDFIISPHDMLSEEQFPKDSHLSLALPCLAEDLPSRRIIRARRRSALSSLSSQEGPKVWGQLAKMSLCVLARGL